MVNILNDTPGSPPMVEVHIWIGHYADGTEGMLAMDLPVRGLGITRHMPLMNSRRATAERFEIAAKQIQTASQEGASPIIRIELRTFRAVSIERKAAGS